MDDRERAKKATLSELMFGKATRRSVSQINTKKFLSQRILVFASFLPCLKKMRTKDRQTERQTDRQTVPCSGDAVGVIGVDVLGSSVDGVTGLGVAGCSGQSPDDTEISSTAMSPV